MDDPLAQPPIFCNGNENAVLINKGGEVGTKFFGPSAE